MCHDASYRMEVNEVPAPQRGCNNTTFPLEPQDIAILIRSTPKAPLLSQVYLQPSDVTELQNLLERISAIGLDKIEKRRGKRLDEATNVKSVAVCKTRFQKDNSEYCTACSTQLATRPDALTLKQHMNKGARRTVVRTAHLHLDCVSGFNQMLDTVLTRHTGRLLPDAL